MRIFIRVACEVFLLFIVVSGLSLAQRLNEGSLRGLKNVAVVIQIDDKHDESLKELKSLLMTTVELKLRQSGIKVTKNAEAIYSVEVGLIDIPIESKDEYHAIVVESSIVQ